MKVIYFILEIVLFGLAVISEYENNIISTMYDIFYIISIFVILCTLCDLIIRLLDQNWKDDMIKALKTSFKYNTVIVLCIAVFITQLTKKEYSLDYNLKPNSVACICLLCFVLIPFIIFSFSQQNMNNHISSMNGLDYGTGMAYSFYYGYLRIILPSTGTASKGLLEKIETFEDVHNVSITIKKLFLLIPSSSYISPDLKELSYDGWIESAQKLETEIRDRAGVKQRTYHNNIYKIYPDGNQSAKPEYVVLEGATPILTYFEVQKHFHPESAIYKTYNEEIIATFYMKLKELINSNPDCKDRCELIYYKDQDSNGKKVNVAKIILERIETLKNSN